VGAGTVRIDSSDDGRVLPGDGKSAKRAKPRNSRSKRRASAPPSPRPGAARAEPYDRGNLLFVAAFAFGFFGPDSVAKAIGLTFLVVAAACGIHAVAAVLRADGNWQAPAMFVLIGVAFALFGFGGYMLGSDSAGSRPGAAPAAFIIRSMRVTPGLTFHAV
jgi:hypothetical protein